jgi:predicted phage terminase large subunit-like protein
LLHAHAPEILYGGAAGGGKTWATLAAAAQYVGVPGYSALMLRENYADLKMRGSWIPLSMAWWNKKAEYNSTHHLWTFPSGATIQFGSLPSDRGVYQYDTAEYQYICIDELVQHSEWRYTFLQGRLRRPMRGPLSHVPVRMRAASNPGNVGHQWVYNRFVNPDTRVPGALYVPARIADNPSLDEAEYRQRLAMMDPVTRAQREEGDWESIDSKQFNREALQRRYKLVNQQFGEGGEYDLDGTRFRTVDCPLFIVVDPASSEKQVGKKGHDPDYTAIVVFASTPRGDLIFVDVFRYQCRIPQITGFVKQAYEQYRPQFVAVEAVGANQGVLQECQDARMVVKRISPKSQDKLVRARPAMIHCEGGRVWFPVRAHWLNEVLNELLVFRGDGKTHDDVVDCLSYACELLDSLRRKADPNNRPFATGAGRQW